MPSHCAGLHVAFASPAARILEYALGANPMLHELVPDMLAPVGGRFLAPTKPGLGVTVNEAFVNKYTVNAAP